MDRAQGCPALPQALQLVGLGSCGSCMPFTRLCLASQQLAWALPAPCFTACPLPPTVLRAESHGPPGQAPLGLGLSLMCNLAAYPPLLMDVCIYIFIEV